MQRYIRVKTDYKNSVTSTYSQSSVIAKWKLPLAFTLLASVFLWRFGTWATSYDFEDDNADWVNPNQVILDVALPENQEETSLIQPNTLAEESEQYNSRWQSFKIHQGGNLGSYFKQAGLGSRALQEVLSTRDANYLKKIYPGQALRLQTNSEGKLYSLQFDVDPLTTLIVTRQDSGLLKSHVEEKPIEKRVAFGGSQIRESFFVAGKHANLDDVLIMELANIFAYDIDFAQDIQPNDHFKVLFEEYFVNGVKVGNGPIVAAEFVNNGKQFRAVRYTDSEGKSSYYTPGGQSLKKAFLRTPVQYTKISSHFNLQRRHPILHKIRAHRGVDYAAPTGTPVKAAGQGKVHFVGTKSGYGNTIILQHGHKYSTLYAHLSRFAKNLRPGQTIKQGQIIGFVGSTGLASGPHLHYEFRINGTHHNPLTVSLPQADGISNQAKPRFLAEVKELFHLMDRHEKVMVATND
jgi:murein DD-endopeptidase MepM/ murein hydrolase activator NlpD